jgi:hypothetical protein
VKRKASRAELEHDKHAKSLFALRNRLLSSAFVKLMESLAAAANRSGRPQTGSSCCRIVCGEEKRWLIAKSM